MQVFKLESKQNTPTHQHTNTNHHLPCGSNFFFLWLAMCVTIENVGTVTNAACNKVMMHTNADNTIGTMPRFT